MRAKKKKTTAVNNIVTFWILVIAGNISPLLACAQADSAEHVNKKRLTTFIAGSAITYGVGMYGLSKLWYEEGEQQSFTFFNDNAEWKQVDKVGHFFTAFYLSYGTQRALRWANVKKRDADLWGSVTGVVLLVPIEIFDGHSAKYGASTGDLIANASGGLLFFAQQRMWNDVRILPKFSYRESAFAHKREDVLGDNSLSRVLKDYNAQTYWLSFDMDKFTTFPRWVNIAVGYGADGMVYARDHQNEENGYKAVRQFYLSPDIDLTAIRSRSKTIRSLLFFLNMVKLPLPAIEISRKGVKTAFP